MKNSSLYRVQDSHLAGSKRLRRMCPSPAVALAVFVVTICQAFGNTYYIDWNQGSDSNSGTAISAPWKHQPYMQGFTGTYAHFPGDRFIFKGGVTWPYACFPLRMLAGGDFENRDYYGVDKAWFSGVSWSQPIFNGGGPPRTIGRFIDSTSYVTIDNFDMMDFYWIAGYGTSYINVGVNNYAQIFNCKFHNWTHSSTGSDDLQVCLGNGTASNTGCVISNCVFDGSASMDSGMAVYTLPVVLNCIVTNVSNGILPNGRPSEVAYCSIGPILTSYTPGVHPNNIEQVGQAGEIRIHHNIVFGAQGICIFVGNPGGPAYIYNNLIFDSDPMPIQIDGRAGGSHASVFNNTIVHPTGTVRNDTGTRWIVTNQNNHVIGGSISPNNGNNLVQTLVQATADGYVAANLWKPVSAFAPTAHAGADLSYTGLKDIDLDLSRKRRPRGSGWDIGAYQYGTSGGSWHIDNVATGLNNGTSWPNAWTSFDDIVWSSIKSGDTIYISGGTGGKTYNEVLRIGASGSSSAPLTIQPGRDSGHNGRVIIDAQKTRLLCIDLGAKSYVTISGNNGAGVTNLLLANATHATDRFAGSAIHNAGTGTTVEYAEVSDCNNGFNLAGAAQTTVRYSYLHGIRGDRAILLSGNDVYDSCAVSNCGIQLNQGIGGQGPDGVQGGSGVTVHDCHIYSVRGEVVPGQHMDALQTIGNHWKIYNTLIENMGNACIEGGSVGSSWNSYLVYNNIWCKTFDSANWYMRGFEFSPNSSINVVSNIYVMNNTMIDMNYRAVYWVWNEQNPAVANVVFANNIFYNCGRDVGDVFNIEDSSAVAQADYVLDYNTINTGATGKSAITLDGAAFSQAHPRAGEPAFTAYTPLYSKNDFHLVSVDRASKDVGTDLSGIIPPIDRDGIPRPQGIAWDTGAYEFPVAGSINNPINSVSVTGLDFGSIPVATTKDLTLLVINTGGGILSGTAGVPAPFSIVSGGSYSLASNQSQLVVIRFNPTAAGEYSRSVAFTGGGGRSVNVSGSAWSVVPSLSLDAASGTIAAPFSTDPNGYVSQAIETLGVDGGTAVYEFTVTNAGQYFVSMEINAPSDASNSLFVMMDADPAYPSFWAPEFIWDILPLTRGIETRAVSHRGKGTFENPTCPMIAFHLKSGNHKLVIGGREANVQIRRIRIARAEGSFTPPAIPSNLTNTVKEAGL